ncbi:MAG: pyruvate kinase [Deltaproteobacteria bacterium]|nr:pyruvate kinase [Deltaproteobacteria bacterium]
MTGRRILRKTKVVATIGPACDSLDTLKAMIRAGMNVARLNFSHGTHAEHHKRLEMIRQAADESSANIGIMLDTRGVEVRTGRLTGGIADLITGEPFNLFSDDRFGDASGVSVSHRELFEEVSEGVAILLDDGVIELRVREIAGDVIRCRVARGGRLGDRKGVNVPGTSLSLQPLTPENRDDLLFAIDHDVTYIAASFVRNAADVLDIRHFLQDRDARIPIIAKIENKEGVENLDEIITVADGTMVARGDLGVEIPLQQVPMAQKKIILATVMNGKPVITATQMLDSMQRNPTPTRAEVSDVANAILDGTSAVMLSGETAGGAYPVEAVRTMAMLALEAESSLPEYGVLQHILPEPSNLMTEAISQAAMTMATHLEAAAMITLTESGFTTRSISKYRPPCPILAVTNWPEVVSQLSLNWGVTAMRFEGERSDDAMIEFAVQRGLELGCLQAGDVVVVTTGIDRTTGSTDTIRVITLD